MASDDKKIKTSPAPKNEVPPNDKSTSDTSKAERGKIPDAPPPGYSRGEGQKPVSKAYKDNWNAIFAKCPFRNFLNRLNHLGFKGGGLIRPGAADVDA